MPEQNEIVSLYSNRVKLRYRDVGHAYARSIDGGDWKEVTGVTTIINKTLHKEGLVLWPLYEAINHLKSSFEDLEVIKYTGSHFHKELLIAEKAHTVKSTKGKDVGSEVHENIEAFLNAKAKSEDEWTAPSLTPEGSKAVFAFLDWFEKVKPKVLATEQLIYSLEYDYAGRFDALLEIDGKIYLCDIKTSNKSRTAPLGIYDNNFVQLGGYSLAYHEALKNELGIEYFASKEWDDAKVDGLMVINVGKDGTLNTLSASDLGLSAEFCEDAFRRTVELYNFLNPLQRQLKERGK